MKPNRLAKTIYATSVGLFLSLLTHSALAERWLLIEAAEGSLSVIENGKRVAKYDGISIGRGGAALVRQQGDAKTPLGAFQVAWINKNSRFKLFFGLDYPNLDYARRAFDSQVIDDQDFAAIETAFRNHQPPPQNTRLGGYIGIHGLGDTDPKIHRRFNWTDGCIALTNQQIADLARWIDLGTKVIIQ